MGKSRQRYAPLAGAKAKLLSIPIRIHMGIQRMITRILIRSPIIRMMIQATLQVPFAGKRKGPVRPAAASDPSDHEQEPATRQIHREMPDIRIIGLSMYDTEHQAEALKAAGAEDFLNKDSGAGDLLAAIRGK